VAINFDNLRDYLCVFLVPMSGKILWIQLLLL